MRPNCSSAPLKITWLNCCNLIEPETVGVGVLPGMKFKEIWRNLEQDISVLKEAGITDIFCICKPSELKFFRVRELLDTYRSRGFAVHHYPIEPDVSPAYKDIRELLENVWSTILEGNKVYIHGRSLLGRISVITAAFLMELEETLPSSSAIQKVRQMVGNGAFQTMQQYNFTDGFREYQAQHLNQVQAQ